MPSDPTNVRSATHAPGDRADGRVGSIALPRRPRRINRWPPGTTMEQPNNEASASSRGRAAHDGVDRRTMLRRLAATSAVAWVAPQVIATDRASAMAQSGKIMSHSVD